jgi:hypothetical protein
MHDRILKCCFPSARCLSLFLVAVGCTFAFQVGNFSYNIFQSANTFVDHSLRNADIDFFNVLQRVVWMWVIFDFAAFLDTVGLFCSVCNFTIRDFGPQCGWVRPSAEASTAAITSSKVSQRPARRSSVARVVTLSVQPKRWREPRRFSCRSSSALLADSLTRRSDSRASGVEAAPLVEVGGGIVVCGFRGSQDNALAQEKGTV